jgi:hypothetical protein
VTLGVIGATFGLDAFLKVYMELGSYFLFLQEQIKDIIIINMTYGCDGRDFWARLLHACLVM